MSSTDAGRFPISCVPAAARTTQRRGTAGATMALLCAAAGACAGSGGSGGPGGDDDDGPGAMSPRVGFASEKETVWEGTDTWPIEVTSSVPASSEIVIPYEVAGTAAGGGVDHGLANGTVTIEAGQTSARLLVPITNDGAVEPAETVQVTLVPGTGALAGEIATHTLTILDDDDRRWPGDAAITTVDAASQFGQNLSGLSYEPAAGGRPAVLWAVKNDPSVLYRLQRTGTLWAPATTDNWTAGKVLHYPGGAGSPDAEGVTRAELTSAAIYVATERDNADGKTNRLSVLRFDTSAAGTTLTATHEWNLTADLPTVGSNLGLEAITWIPDSALVAQGFYDAHLAQPYDPSRYPGHGTGLFLVGLEGNGMVYAYALDHVGGGFQQVASFASGHPAVMGLSFDRDSGYLWSVCDDTCNGDLAILAIETNPLSPSHGRFVLRRGSDRPSGMPNLNNEDIAIVPDAECVANRKTMFWTDDSATGGHALRQGSMPCGATF
jgi:Calx-beta domain